MRKIVVLCLAVALVGGLAGPVSAKPTRSKSESANANAFWYTTTWNGPRQYTTTVWYVGIYTNSTWGTWSDVYMDTYTCRISRRGERCVYGGSLYGETDLSDGGTFTIDRTGLTSAHLDATYPLSDGNGRITRTRVVVDWEGHGDIQTDGGTWTFRNRCFSYRSTYSSTYRMAEAYGSVDGVSIGDTYDAWIGVGSSSDFSRVRQGCETEF